MVKISVIVPIYNTKESYLKECVESLLSQTLEDIEIILSDDASTDVSTVALIDEYQKKHSDQIRVIHSSVNRRQGGARNIGIKAATGKYLAFVDSDDCVDPDAYRQIYEYAEQHHTDVTAYRYKRFSDNGEEFGESRLPDIWNLKDVSDGMLQALFLNPQSVFCKLFLTSVIQNNALFFPEHIFYEDNAWCPLTMLYVKRIGSIDKAFYKYRLNPSSTTEGGNSNTYFDRCKSAMWLDRELKVRRKYEGIKPAEDFWFFHCYYASTIHMCINGFSKVYWKELYKIRSQTKIICGKYWVNGFYKKDVRKYETEEKIYMRLAYLSPVLCVFAIKMIEYLRIIKHRMKKNG